jgi:hypothetical protein
MLAWPITSRARYVGITMKGRKFFAGSLAIYLMAIMGMILLIDSSHGEEDQLKAFHNWAIEYAIKQQNESQYKLTDYENMDFYDLDKLLRKPWEDKRMTLRNQLENLSNSEAEKIWNQTMTDDDEQLMQLFRENLHNGNHCEAWIYHKLLYFKPNQMTAAQEAFEVYIKGYEQLRSQLETFVAEETAKPYYCQPYKGSSKSSLIYPVSEGVQIEYPDAVTRLYSGPKSPSDWPFFPVMRVNFGLSDGSESPWNDFIIADIRHYDRTNGHSLRNCLDWMIDGWGVYERILNEKGLEAAKEAVRNNLSIESDANFIEFRDNNTQNGVALYETNYGTVQMIKRKNFHSRCTPGNDDEIGPNIADPIPPDCREECPANAKCLTREESRKKCDEEKKFCNEASKEPCSCNEGESKFCFYEGCPTCNAVDSDWSRNVEAFLMPPGTAT